jgi:hypothetical protein
VEWASDFTALVLHFAKRYAEVNRLPLQEVLLRGTPLYPNFSLGTGFDPDHPVWREFLAGYQASDDPVDWTHRFYIAHARQYPPHPYGCFRSHYNPDTRTAGLHFGNLDTSGQGSLSSARRPARLTELRAMFADMRQAHPDAEFFAGGSWLYNLPAYRSLFPSEYIDSMTSAHPSFTYLSTWGQFLDGRWQLRSDPAAQFSANLETARTHEDLERAFPLPSLSGCAPINIFYAFHHF